MFTVTGFADELAADWREQLEGMKRLGFRHVELRAVWGTNVLKLNDEQIAEVKRLLAEHDCRVSSIASPIGKYPVTDEFEPQLAAMRRAIELAQELRTPYIRLFSFHIPAGEDPANYREEVIRRMRELTLLAEQGGVTLVLENDNGRLYGDIDERVYDIVKAVHSSALRLAFDPGNFVLAGVAPMTQAYEKLAPYIGYIHIKDADRAKKIFVEAGAGDGELQTLLRKLKETGFSGYLSIEPHLGKAYPDETNADRFAIAANALKKLLEAESAAWN